MQFVGSIAQVTNKTAQIITNPDSCQREIQPALLIPFAVWP